MIPAVFLLLSLPLTGGTALAAIAAQAASGPREAVMSTVEHVLEILREESDDSRAQRDKLVGTVSERFDYAEMGRRTLGRRWKTLGAAQRRTFVDTFRRFLADSYAGRLQAYSGEKVTYLDHRRVNGYAEVRTRVTSDETDTSVAYRLHRDDGEWLVYDVVIGGVSLVSNYRAQFERILEDGSYEALLDALRGSTGDAITNP